MNNKSKILYVFDPMCGWCYGFSKVIDQFFLEHNQNYDFEIISGGMVVGDREGEIGDFANYILDAYHRVEEYSGIKYGEPYLDQLKTKKLWSSSVMPSIALETFKHFKLEQAIIFGSKIQYEYFYNGKDLRNIEVYKTLIKPYKINEVEFVTLLQSEEMRKAASDGFQAAANFGITGYPAVIMLCKEKYYLAAKGFADLKTFTNTIKKIENL